LIPGLLEQTVKDLAILMTEYLYQKRRSIKKLRQEKNSILKITALYKEKNLSIIKSKDIAHMNNIIEEYIDLDIINDDILFINGKIEINSKKYSVPVNHLSV
jgi:hypothetical protein